MSSINNPDTSGAMSHKLSRRRLLESLGAMAVVSACKYTSNSAPVVESPLAVETYPEIPRTEFIVNALGKYREFYNAQGEEFRAARLNPDQIASFYPTPLDIDFDPEFGMTTIQLGTRDISNQPGAPLSISFSFADRWDNRELYIYSGPRNQSTDIFAYKEIDYENQTIFSVASPQIYYSYPLGAEGPQKIDPWYSLVLNHDDIHRLEKLVGDIEINTARHFLFDLDAYAKQIIAEKFNEE